LLAVPKYPFLSDEWVAEAERLREEYRGTGPPVAVAIRMNQVITDVPFGDGTEDAHIDTSSGQLELGLGHLDDPDVTVTLDYETARSFFVDGSPQAAMQAFMAGKLKVQGDMTKLIESMQEQSAPSGPEVESLRERIRAITA
jgi:putative sterol carrier protein